MSQAKQDADHHKTGKDQYKRDVSGNVHVRGEVEAKLPESFIQQHKTERGEDTARGRKKFCVEVLTLIAVLAYTTVAFWQGCSNKTAADAAKSAADTATAALTKVQRAFVFAESVKCGVVNTPSGGVLGMTCVVNWRNSGTTPTKDLHVHTNFKVSPDPRPDDFSFPNQWREGEPHINKSVVERLLQDIYKRKTSMFLSIY